MDESLDRERWQRLSAILDAALELPPEARAHYLDQACGGGSLRRQVEELLAAEAAAGSFLATPAVEQAGLLLAENGENLEGPASGAAVGRVVGVYRLVDELGEGGMGSVYLAQREDGQFEQQVALKLLKQGLRGEEARRRFLQERQILARLEHPAIARLLDGGVTEDDVPFFVMERVLGQPVTDYCRERRLGIEPRLRVFLQICDAVHYAHANLVVHRDLKPSNVLVTASGQVKLLDFGIAKLLAPEDDGVTRTGMRLMTPDYAAPEQLAGGAITTATDVFALGVVLYELLTGERPFRGRSELPERAELDRQPERPSTLVARQLPGSPGRDGQRLLRGDLDAIVLKALRREPERRYASVEAFGSDLRRFLGGQPVLARGDALRYRAGKFLRRHRVSVSAAALVVLALAGGLVATNWQARRAEREARKAEAVKDFLKSLFSASDPAQALGQRRSARDLLEDGARRIETELRDQPEVQSEVARLIAAVYLQLGEHDRALPLLDADLARRRHLDGPHSLAVAESLTQLADVHYEQGRFDEARAMYEQALSIQRAKRGERSPQVAELLWDLAGVKRNRGDLRGAEDLQQQALAIYVGTRGADSPEAASVRGSLTITYAEGGRFGEAAAMAEQVAAWHERHHGADHPDTLNARFNLGGYLLALGRSSEATRLALDVVSRQRRVLGARHDRLALSLRLLARALDDAGRAEEALPAIAEAVAIHRERFGASHPQVAMDLAWQALIEARVGRLVEAERDVRWALALFTAQPGMAAGDLATMRAYSGVVLAEAGHLEEADERFSQAVSALRAEGSGGVFLGRALDALGDVVRRRGQTARAAELGQEALALLEGSIGADHPATALARAHAGAALWAAGQAGKGERLMRAGLQGLEARFPDGHPDLATARFLLGDALRGSDGAVEVRPLLQAALEWRQVHFGPVDPRTAAVRRALGSVAKGTTGAPPPSEPSPRPDGPRRDARPPN